MNTDEISSQRYAALSLPPRRSAGNSVELNLYRDGGKEQHGRFRYQAPTTGLVQTGWPGDPKVSWTDRFDIAWTKIGDQGPLCLLLHGVPCNRAQWADVQRFLGRSYHQRNGLGSGKGAAGAELVWRNQIEAAVDDISGRQVL